MLSSRTPVINFDFLCRAAAVPPNDKRGPGAPGLRGRPPCKLQLAASTPPGLAQIHAEQLDGTDEIFQLLFYILRPHI
jgi:hypothetical protein